MSYLIDMDTHSGRIRTSVMRDLAQMLPGGLEADVSLAAISRWGVGGVADLVLRPQTVEQVAILRHYFYENGIRHVVIGATSNLLFSDEGLRVPCIQIGKNLSRIIVSGRHIFVEAGAWVPELARALMKVPLEGAEHICGIPGTVGGLICMNGGSQRKGIGSAVNEVLSVNRVGVIVRRGQEECGFAYRRSIFQENGDIITSACLELSPAADKSTVRRRMLNILMERRRKFPRKYPNCGSVFKSDPAMYEEVGAPGVVIEKLGFKGHRIGGALVSPQHANFIINDGAATASDILALIAEISSVVVKSTGWLLDVEVLFVTVNGKVLPASGMEVRRSS